MGVEATEFKPTDPKRILDEDEPGGFDHFQPKPKNKKIDPAKLKEAAKQKKLEEDAKLPTKGKPSEFFIMDWLPGDTNDVTGQCRVPTGPQKLFIYEHYPTCSQLPMMITKIYELYFSAKAKEDKELEQEAYKKPGYRKNKNKDVDELEVNDG